MERIRIPGHEKARNRLLEEGARSYLEATSALIAYEQEVQEKCREVMEKYIRDYSSALRVQPSLKSEEIQSVVYPKSSQSEGNWRTVGVEIRRTNTAPAIRWWGALCCLVWQLEDPRLYGWVGEWYYPAKVAGNLFQKFHGVNPKVETDGPYEIGIGEGLKAEEGATFDEKLEGLFEEWIKLWKKVGGIKEVFRG